MIYGVSVERKERKGESERKGRVGREERVVWVKGGSGVGDRDMQQTDIKHLSIDSALERLLCLCCLRFHTQRTEITKVPTSDDCSEG